MSQSRDFFGPASAVAGLCLMTKAAKRGVRVIVKCWIRLSWRQSFSA
jgi:hypothetical protein